MTQPTYKELLAQAADLTRQAEEAKRVEARAALETCKALIAEFEFTAVDLGLVKTQVLPPSKANPTFKAKLPKSPYPPKYRNPSNGQTWSGRGHQPRWIEGNKDDYLIDDKPRKRATQNNKEQ